MRVTSRVLPPLTWQISQIIVDFFLQLFQPMFLTNPMVIGLLVMFYTLPFPQV